MVKKDSKSREKKVALRNKEIRFARTPQQHSAKKILSKYLFETLPAQLTLANVAVWLSEKFSLDIQEVGDFLLKTAIGGEIDVYGYQASGNWAKGQVRWDCRFLEKPKLRLDADGNPVGIKFYVEKPSLENIDFYRTGVNPIQALHALQEKLESRAALSNSARVIEETNRNIQLEGLDNKKMIAIFGKRMWRFEREVWQTQQQGENASAQELKTLEEFENNWLRKFANPSKWLEDCRVEKGAPGKKSSTWNPITFCQQASKKNLLTEDDANEAFKAEELLKPWLAEWEKQQS